MADQFETKVFRALHRIRGSANGDRSCGTQSADTKKKLRQLGRNLLNSTKTNKSFSDGHYSVEITVVDEDKELIIRDPTHVYQLSTVVEDVVIDEEVSEIPEVFVEDSYEPIANAAEF